MPRRDPLVLLLPFDLVDSFDLRKLIAERSDERWRDGYRLLEQFALRSQERQFARDLLARKSNIWLFRCNQRAFCGDFITVDMSDRRIEARTCTVIELKMGAPLTEDSGSSVQVARWPDAIREIADEHGVIDAGCSPSIVSGGEAEVLDYLCR